MQMTVFIAINWRLVNRQTNTERNQFFFPTVVGGRSFPVYVGLLLLLLGTLNEIGMAWMDGWGRACDIWTCGMRVISRH